MNKTVLIVLVVIILLAGGLFFVQSQNQTTQPTDTTQVEQNQPTNAMEAPEENEAMEADPSATEAEGTVKEFTIEGGDFSFTPNAITVNQGDTVRITLVSNDMMHDFVIDELGVATSQLPAGEQETIEFVADQAGTFEFYCSVGNHREMGMVGTLTVQ